jgi:hypothetical protein
MRLHQIRQQAPGGPHRLQQLDEHQQPLALVAVLQGGLQQQPKPNTCHSAGAAW